MKKHFIAFLKSDKASAVIEFAVCIPVLVTAFLGMWDLVNFSLAKAKAQNQAMVLAQMVTDPKFCLTYAADIKQFGDYHQQTRTFGMEQILSLLNTAEGAQKYTYDAIFEGVATDSGTGKQGLIHVEITANGTGSGSVQYINSSGVPSSNTSIKVSVTYAISTPFLQFAFPSSVQTTVYSYPIAGQLNYQSVPNAPTNSSSTPKKYGALR